MKQGLENKLFEKYPKIFKQKDLSMKETCMCWGIECGDGWYYLIDKLCSNLQWNTDRNKYPQVEATQVKEKYGGLRFYYTIVHKPNDKYYERHCGVIDGMVSIIESLSEETCELCGSTKEVTQTEGWVKTICKECLEKWNRK